MRSCQTPPTTKTRSAAMTEDSDEEMPVIDLGTGGRRLSMEAGRAHQEEDSDDEPIAGSRHRELEFQTGDQCYALWSDRCDDTAACDDDTQPTGFDVKPEVQTTAPSSACSCGRPTCDWCSHNCTGTSSPLHACLPHRAAANDEFALS